MRIADRVSFSRRMVVSASAAFLIALGALPLAHTDSARADDSSMTSSGASMAMPHLVTSAIAAGGSAPLVASAPSSRTAALSASGTGAIKPVAVATTAASNAATYGANRPNFTSAEPMHDMAAVPEAPMSGKPSAGNSEIGKKTAALEEKATENAKGMVKHLDSNSESLTLEDLNSARQVVARLDAMIDVEKHLAELDKIHAERVALTNKSSAPASTAAPAAMANAIPASALTPPPASTSLPPVTRPAFSPAKEVEREKEKPKEAEKPKSVLAGLEVARITGAEGKYAALLRMSDGEMRPVRVGDQISDHATVRWITSSTVLIEEFGSTHTVRVKNVGAIYSAMR